MSTVDGEAAILVVDDDHDVADLYALHIEQRATTPARVEVAYGGEQALEMADEDTDLVLLDRRMPGMTGDEVLEELRARGLDCAVLMITAVDPDFDIVDMPFDGYLCKPIDAEDLLDAVEMQLAVQEENERLREYLEVTAKLTLLEVEKTPGELADNDSYADLEAKADALESAMQEEFDEEDVEEVVRSYRTGTTSFTG